MFTQMLAQTLNILIPAAVVGYGIYLLVRMLRGRSKSCGCGGCMGCPMAGGCEMIREKERKEGTSNE